ncbi:MAG: thioredoxin domain-containing protein, partial [Thermoplasmata archaeon]
ITAVAHRLAFTVYALWKKGVLYEETEVKRYSEKRRRLAKRATVPVEVSSVAGAVDKLIGELGHTKATS